MWRRFCHVLIRAHYWLAMAHADGCDWSQSSLSQISQSLFNSYSYRVPADYHHWSGFGNQNLIRQLVVDLAKSDTRSWHDWPHWSGLCPQAGKSFEFWTCHPTRLRHLTNDYLWHRLALAIDGKLDLNHQCRWNYCLTIQSDAIKKASRPLGDDLLAWCQLIVTITQSFHDLLAHSHFLVAFHKNQPRRPIVKESHENLIDDFNK